MDRSIFVKYNIFTREENSRINEQSEMIKSYGKKVSETLQNEYSLYCETCSEVLLKEQEEMEAIQNKISSKEFRDIYANRKFEGNVRQLLDEMANTEYRVLASLKKLKHLHKQILDLEKRYQEEKNLFIEEVKKDLNEEEWLKHKECLCANELFNKLCNANLLAG